MKKTLLPLLLALLATTAQAEVRLSNVFGEHMVLQRDHPLRFVEISSSGAHRSIRSRSRATVS